MNLRGAARRNIERLLEKMKDADDPEGVIRVSDAGVEPRRSARLSRSWGGSKRSSTESKSRT
jgi:hypothetical protein